MRVAPIGWTGADLAQVLSLSEESAKTSHNHPEGIRGAQAIATAVHLAKIGATKEEIRACLQEKFSYPLAKDEEQLQKTHDLGCTCQYSVPTALGCFLLGKDFEDTIRKSVLLGGDTDTVAAMSGAVAEAFYGGVPKDLVEKAEQYLLKDTHGEDLLQVVKKFRETYLLLRN
jgi:ADP-ribosylglycohydrolase